MQPHVRSASARSNGTFRSERGDIMMSWLTKIVVVTAVAGVMIFDAVSVGVTATTLTDQGNYAARQASESWQETSSVQKAYDAALAVAVEANPHNTIDTQSFTIDDDDTVHLTISRVATTLVLYRWDKTADWAKLSRTVKGRSVA